MDPEEKRLFRVVRENPFNEPDEEPQTVWEGMAFDRTDAIMESGFDEQFIVDVEEA